MANKKEIEKKVQPVKEKKTVSKVSSKETKSASTDKTEKAKTTSKKSTDTSKKNTKTSSANTKNANSSTKTNKTARNTGTSKNLKKQAKKSDDRIKQILSEQLANIRELEINNTTVKVKNDKPTYSPYTESVEKKENKEKTLNEKEPSKKEKKKFINTSFIKREKGKDKDKDKGKDKNKDKDINKDTEIEDKKQEERKTSFKPKQKYDPKAVEVKIANKRKLPKEDKKRIIKEIWINMLVACVMSLFLTFLNLGFKNIEGERFVTDLKVFSIILILITIFLFEKAYKKDSGIEALYGVECFVLAVGTLVLAYIKIGYPIYFIKITVILNIVISLYYCVKSFVIYLKEKIKYKNSISDVKEIIEEE